MLLKKVKKVGFSILATLMLTACDGGCSKSEKPAEEAAAPTDAAATGTTPEGTAAVEGTDPAAAPTEGTAGEGQLSIEDIKVGTGAEAQSGSAVKVHYVGTLTDGTKFDSSRDRNILFDFNVGRGDVIKGWDQGVVGMKVGGLRKLTIPSSLGYGEKGVPGVIPANATLVFEIELVEVN